MKNIGKKLLEKKNFIVFLLIASFLISLPVVSEPIHATSASDKKKEAEKELENIEDKIDDIEGERDELEGEIADVRQKLSNLIDQQEILHVQIADTQDSIASTRQELETARAEADEQYAAMKIRIQYMYENSTVSDWLMILLEADGFADFLNRIEYISSIYQADRDLTEQYQETVVRVEEMEQTLLLKLDDLLVKEEAFLGQQAEIKQLLSGLEGAYAEYEYALADAEKKADEYRKTIEEQNEIIRKEQEEKKEPSYPSGQDVTGEELVQYAMKFVGNPYVWGGDSLTEGCDCSGFVHLIYKQFGYHTVRYSMSFLYEGVAVDRADIRPGDIVVYAMKNGIGHVAIYAGNGKIVEAQSSNAGITANRSVDCREIIGIRRILN